MQLSRLGFIRAFIESVGPSIRCGVSGALPSRYTVDDRARSDSGSGVRLPRPPRARPRVDSTPHRTRPPAGRTGARGPHARGGHAARHAPVRCAVTLGAGAAAVAGPTVDSRVPSRPGPLKNLLNQSIELKDEPPAPRGLCCTQDSSLRPLFVYACEWTRGVTEPPPITCALYTYFSS